VTHMKDVEVPRGLLGATEAELASVEPAEFGHVARRELHRCIEHIERLEKRIAHLETAAQPLGLSAKLEPAVTNMPRQVFTPGR
jgi:predicted Zn-dependent protease